MKEVISTSNTTSDDWEERLRRQTEAINWAITYKLSDDRTHDVVPTSKCVGCGDITHICYTYTESLKCEPNCHDCAWPKVGSYLREKEEKRMEEERQKDQEKAKSKLIYDGCCTVDNPCSWHDGN